MTNRAIGRDRALGVAIDTKSHVDFMDRYDSIHILHIAVTLLALNSRVDVWAMREANEIRQRVHPVPSNLEWRLLLIGPRTRDRRDSTGESGAMTSDASRDRRNSRGLRASRILVTILARNFIDAGVDAMAKRDRLLDISTRRPWALRKSDGGESEDQQCDS